MNVDSSATGGKRLRATWPERKITGLLQAGLAGEATAKAGFAHWREVQELDLSSWSEVRLLAAGAKRLAEIAPDYPHHGRIQGFRRYIFTHSHRMLHGTRPMLEALHGAGIAFMLLKGAVRLAVDPGLAAERFMSDVDVLIHVADWPRACALAVKERWFLPPKRRIARFTDPAATYPYAHSLDFASAEEPRLGHLDLHHHARHMCRNDGDDDGLWEHSQPAQFLGIPARIPSPTDQLAVSLTHALTYARQPQVAPGDWALDMALTLKSGPIDWQRLVRDTIALQTQAFVGAALLFGREQLELPIDADALGELTGAITSQQLGELEYFHTDFPGSVRRPRLALKARDVAIARAKAAYLREGRTPAARSVRLRLGAPPAVPAVLAKGSQIDVALPQSLRPSDQIELQIDLKTEAGAVKTVLVVDSPGPVLAVWTHQRTKGEAPPRQARIVVPIVPELFIMGRGDSVALQVKGAPVSDLKVVWRQVPLLTRLRRRLSRIKRRLGRTLRPKAG